MKPRTRRLLSRLGAAAAIALLVLVSACGGSPGQGDADGPGVWNESAWNAATWQ